MGWHRPAGGPLPFHQISTSLTPCAGSILLLLKQAEPRVFDRIRA